MERRVVIKIQLLVVEENEMERRGSSVEVILGVRRFHYSSGVSVNPLDKVLSPIRLTYNLVLMSFSCFIAYIHLYRNIPPHRSVLPFIL